MNIEERESARDGDIVDESDTLGAVMKSKGLCGVFDHDFVENTSSKKKSLSVIEMEENATKVCGRRTRQLKKPLAHHVNHRPCHAILSIMSPRLFFFDVPWSTRSP